MRLLTTRIGKTLIPAALLGAMVFAVAPTATAGTAPDARIVAKGQGAHFHFVHRLTEIPSDGTLKFVNRTDEPHTLSLVTKEEVPRTDSQIRHCFDKPGSKHICRRIFRAHKKAGGGFRKVVNRGQPGLDTPFVLPDAGDSLLLFPHKSRLTTVSANPNKTLYYICGIHPWMHGRIHTNPPAH